MNRHIGLFFLCFAKDFFGGIEHAIFNLAKGIVKAGAAPFIFTGYLGCSETQKNCEETSIDHIIVYRSKLLPSKIPEGDATVMQSLREQCHFLEAEVQEFCKRFNIDCVLVCDPLWGILQYSGIIHRLDIPKVLWLHVLNEQQLLSQASASNYDLHLYVSAYLQERTECFEILTPSELLSNCIDLESFENSSITVPQASTIIFCNARLAPEKGIIDLIEAMPHVLKKFPTAILWLCNGEFIFERTRQFRDEVKAVVDSMRLQDSIVFVPQLKWTDVPIMIKASTLVVIPSHSETFGLAALEAMASSKPVIVTSVGNLPTLVGEAGLIVAPGQPEALASAITKILDDRNLACILGERGHDRAVLYSDRTVASGLLKSLEKRVFKNGY